MSDTFDHCCDAYDRMWNGEGDGYADRNPNKVICKYCKKSGFMWDIVNGKWRLVDEDGKVHSCRNFNKGTYGGL